MKKPLLFVTLAVAAIAAGTPRSNAIALPPVKSKAQVVTEMRQKAMVAGWMIPLFAPFPAAQGYFRGQAAAWTEAAQMVEGSL